MQVIKCPVCEGRGVVKPEFLYQPVENGPQGCRACNGQGVFIANQPVTDAVSPYIYPQPYQPTPVIPNPTWITFTSDTTVNDVLEGAEQRVLGSLYRAFDRVQS